MGELLKDIEKQFDIPYYADMDVIMQNENIDVVSVLTESENHAKYVKYIVVEKVIL